MVVPNRKTRISARFWSDSTAVVDAGAVVGKGTKIWHFCHVIAGARIGAHCTLGQNVMVGGRAVVGDHVKIQNNVSVFDGVTLEDDVFCGPSVVFTNVINPRARVSRKGEYKSTLVRRGATIGANATILCGIEIGEGAFIGAGAIVTRDVPAYALALGNPARMAGWMCACGVKLIFARRGKAARAKCAACGRSYRRIGNDQITEAESGKVKKINHQDTKTPRRRK